MDRLGTWEVPLTSTRRQAGKVGRRLNIDPGPEGNLRLSGSASESRETRTEEVSVGPGSETNK